MEHHISALLIAHANTHLITIINAQEEIQSAQMDSELLLIDCMFG